MKIVLLTLVMTLFVSHSLFAEELEWVDEQIQAIKPPRKSVKIHGAEDPFVFLEKNGFKKKEVKQASLVSAKPKTASTASGDFSKPSEDTVEKASFILTTVINSSAMIDGNWYKKSDKIKGYDITDISKTSVTLEKGDKKLTLSTNSKKSNLKFKNK